MVCADSNRIGSLISVTSFCHIVYWSVGKFLRELPEPWFKVSRGRDYRHTSVVLRALLIVVLFAVFIVCWVRLRGKGGG